jgi:tetratricopeptide (TPR) repeat protein
MRGLAIALLTLPALAQDGRPALDLKLQPKPAQSEPADRAERMDALLDRLALTDDAREAKAVETLVWKYWVESGSPTADLLLEHGTAAMSEDEYKKARSLFDAVIDLKPDFAEAWNKRATLNFMVGNDNASLEDIAKVLSLEPRHFGALAGRGMIYERQNKKALALESYRRALAAYPAMAGMKDKIRKLALEVEGQRI